MPPLIFNGHSEFHDTTLTCPNCGWTGTGKDTKLGYSWDSGVSEHHCPQCLAGYVKDAPSDDPLAVTLWSRVK